MTSARPSVVADILDRAKLLEAAIPAEDAEASTEAERALLRAAAWLEEHAHPTSTTTPETPPEDSE